MHKIIDYKFIEQLKSLDFIEEIWLFGSRARGDNHQKADIDLAILAPNASEADWQIIYDILEQADTLLEIDCLNFNPKQISNTLYQNILNEKKVIYVKT